MDNTPVNLVAELEADVEATLEEALVDPDPLGVEDPKPQIAIFELYGVRPLTPLSRHVGLTPITTVYKNAVRCFKE